MEAKTVFPVFPAQDGTGQGPASSITDTGDGVSASNQFLGLKTVARLTGWDPTNQVFDRLQQGGDDADAQATVVRGRLKVVSRLYGFNGTTFDRLRSGGDNADAVATATLGRIITVSRLTGFNGSTFDRLRSGGDSTDAQATSATGIPPSAGRLYAYNGATFDRMRSNAAANIDDTTQPFAQMVANPGEWSVNHTPTSNTQATASQAAGAAGVRHVCRSISAALNALAAAAETTVLLNLRDGATGAGTILWSLRLHAIPAGTTGIALSGLNIFGTAATAMTLEFAAAGGANTFESVSMTGYSTI